MKITIITNDNSKYLYNIVSINDFKGYRSWLETIEGNKSVEFVLDTYPPMESILELKSILNNQGIRIKHVESVEDCFHPKEEFLEWVSKIQE